MVLLELPQDFKELLRFFLDQRVRFVIVGGYAVAFHGYPRFTGDLDLWVETSKTNAHAIVRALKDFGFDTPNLCEELFLGADSITRMGVEPMKVEIFTHIPGLLFSNAIANAVTHEIFDLGPLLFLCLDDLKTSKRVSGRLQDLADLENLP